MYCNLLLYQTIVQYWIIYSKIPLSRTWFISNTPLILNSIAGPGCFPYINGFKNSWYLEHGYLEYPAYLEVYLWSQTLILPRLSRSAAKFLVCITYLASLRHQFTPIMICATWDACSFLGVPGPLISWTVWIISVAVVQGTKLYTGTPFKALPGTADDTCYFIIFSCSVLMFNKWGRKRENWVGKRN
jgi:hypothetical protein